MRVFAFGANNNGIQILEGVSGIFITASATFLLLTLIASIRLFQKAVRLRIEEKNSAVLKEQIKRIQNQDPGGIYAELRGMRHDMKNHLANVRLLAKSAIAGKPETGDELDKYLDKMGGTLETLDFAYDTGNSVSDAVIQQKYMEARRKHISFSSDFFFPDGLGIDAFDLAVILGNALDNACEACDNVPEQERFIRLGARVKGGMFFVEVENSCAGDVTFDSRTGLPVSGKGNGAGHGFGLLNIRRVARKYLGDVDIRISDKGGIKKFMLVIMLQEKL
jgi:sensor histidine kinase regulating citrate/malate metabolism